MNEPAEVIYDWNLRGHEAPYKWPRVALHDETLRDGLQSPSVKDPDRERKHQILRLLDELSVDTADIGLPGAGQRAIDDITALVEQVRDEKLAIRPTVACRTHPADIQPAIEISQRTGVPLEAMMFLGTSPIRLYAEGWDEDRLERLTRDAMRMAKEGGLGATFVTEDTVRSSPTTLRRLFTAAIEEGATCLILCDTVGHATPAGVHNLLRWTHDLLLGLGVRDRVSIDWHGHDDRGLSLINTLAAVQAGADRIHGSILGIGERVGNCSLDHVMVNLRLLGADERDLSSLDALVQLVSEATETPIPVNYPVFGADAFRTATGVHAAAVIKAERKHDTEIADRVYSGVPARWVGRSQEIAVGFMSGASNVRYWLESRGLDANDEVVGRILDRAKSSQHLLSDDELHRLAAG
jgi:2-isopropylmalate synthase